MEENQNIDKEILFFRYCSGVATPGEKTLVEELIAGSSVLSDELEEVSYAVGVQEKVNELESYSIDPAYSRVHYIIRRKERRRKLISILYRAAAVLAVPLLLTSLIFGYMVFNKVPDEILYVEAVSAPGVVSRFE